MVQRCGGLSFVRMNNVIRRAEARDVPRMLELVHELALFERAPQEVTVTVDHMRDAGFGSDPVWVGWVAESEGVIVGMAVCYERYSTWKGRRLYLEDIVVTESMPTGRPAGTQANTPAMQGRNHAATPPLQSR